MDNIKTPSGSSISEEDARTIVGLCDACFSEGLGPDFTAILAAIREQRPDLVADKAYLFSAPSG